MLSKYTLPYSGNLRVLPRLRRVDDLGRIVLPMEIRTAYGIEDGDALDVIATPDGILLRPVKSGRARPGSPSKA